MGESANPTISSGKEGMISAKDAAIAATRYFVEITGISSGVTVDEVELEQIDGEKYWMITLGHSDPGGGLPVPLGGRRHYKVLKVHAQTGEVLSMKMRDI